MCGVCTQQARKDLSTRVRRTGELAEAVANCLVVKSFFPEPANFRLDAFDSRIFPPRLHSRLRSRDTRRGGFRLGWIPATLELDGASLEFVGDISLRFWLRRGTLRRICRIPKGAVR
jgi:hypothetical protein